MNVQQLQLPRINFNKYTFRLIIIGFVIGFIASQLFWAGRLFAGVLNFPELRHNIVIQQSSSQDNRHLARLSIVNRGFGLAQNVFVHVNTGGLPIQSYEIDAQELYEIKTLIPERGVVDVWLDRLAPSAQVEISIVGEGLSQDMIKLSAASDQGTSAFIEQQTFSDQVQEFAGSITRILSEAWQIVVDSRALQQLSKWVSIQPSLIAVLETIETHDFQAVSLAVLGLVLLVRVFFSYRIYTLSVIAGILLIDWLFIGIMIPIVWFGILVILILALRWAAIRQRVEWAGKRGRVIPGLIILLIGVAGGYALWWKGYDWIPMGWLLGVLIVAMLVYYWIIDWSY